MIAGGYDDVYVDPTINHFSIIHQHFSSVGSFIANACLIFLLIAHGSVLGNYRLLLLLLAITDTVHCIVHYLAYPIAETATDAFLLGAHGLVQNRTILSLYMTLYSLTFPLLCANFTYRLLVLIRPNAVRSIRRFVLIELAIVFAVGATCFCFAFFFFSHTTHFATINGRLCSGSEDGISTPLFHRDENCAHYLVAQYWNNGTFSGVQAAPLFGSVFTGVFLFTSYIYMTICSVLIMRFMRAHICSMASLRLQTQLFRCLLMQTIFPTVTAYIPALFVMLAPIVGISWPANAIIIPNLCVLHTLLDGVIVMISVAHFRKRVLRLVSRVFCNTNPFYKISALSNASFLH